MKKRILSLCLALMLALSLLPMAALAASGEAATESTEPAQEPVEDEAVPLALDGDGSEGATSAEYFNFNNGTITGFKEGSNPPANIVIPAAIDGTPVTRIGDSAFRGCTSLTSVSIPSSVTRIGSMAFQNCTRLENVTISGATEIKEYAFADCTELESVTMSSVTRIAMCAFRGCTNLESVTLPASTIYIGLDVFGRCTSLTAIHVDSANANYSSEGGVLFNKDKTTIVCVPKGISGAYTIPSGVTKIGSAAFGSCTKITSITIPNTVTTIDSNAFAACTALTSITIPNSVTQIENFAFNGCSSLTNVYYLGTKNGWNSVAVDSYGNDALSNNVKSVGNITSAFALVSPSNPIYDGTKKEVTVTTTDTGYGAVTVKYYKDGQEATPINAGTYTVKIDIAASETYDAVTGFELGSFTIAKATPSVTDPTAQNSIAAGAALSEVGLPDGWNWVDGTAIPTVGNGGYKAYYTPTDTNNYDWTTVDGWNVSSNRVERTVSVVVDGSAPVIAGIETGKTYCEAQTVMVTDDNSVATVTVNGTPVTLANGAFTLSPAQGEQTIVATDAAGNTATVTVTVNNGHTGGTATCKDQAVCDICSKPYGEPDAGNHTTLEHVEAKAATTEAEGNVEYWCCAECDKCFSDEAGKEEIALSDTAIEKLTPTPTPAPTAAPTAKPAQSPKTGDSATPILWIVIAVVAAAAVVVIVVMGKKKKN